MELVSWLVNTAINKAVSAEDSRPVTHYRHSLIPPLSPPYTQLPMQLRSKGKDIPIKSKRHIWAWRYSVTHS